MTRRVETTPPMAKLPADELRNVVANIQSKWWCVHGAHACAGPQLRYHGHRICEQCKAEVTEGNRKRSKARG